MHFLILNYDLVKMQGKEEKCKVRQWILPCGFCNFSFPCMKIGNRALIFVAYLVFTRILSMNFAFDSYTEKLGMFVPLS
jgi:hypothetical protein